MRKIGFLGPRGTFSQEAVERYLIGKTGYKSIEYGAISDLVAAVSSKELDEAIVPIENSIEGAVNATMDMLASKPGLMITDELVISIGQNLLVMGDIKIEDIKFIMSHPQAIGQCRDYITKNLKGAEIIYMHSTAAAAEEVSKGRKVSAAIASILAAREYNLKILASGIQDGNNNMTRFVVLSDKDGERTGKDRTSIVFSAEDKPGSLFKVLEIFNFWEINMTRIESRPSKEQLGNYIFFVDIEGHREDVHLKNALEMVKKKTSFFKFLGSYPIHII